MSPLLLAALEDCVDDGQVLARLVERPDLVDAILDHPAARDLDPWGLAELRRLQAAQQDAVALSARLEVVVLDDTGVARYEATF